jgi:hypothetical protein
LLVCASSREPRGYCAICGFCARFAIDINMDYTYWVKSSCWRMRLIYSCLCSKLPKFFGKSIAQFNILYDFIRHTT